MSNDYIAEWTSRNTRAPKHLYRYSPTRQPQPGFMAYAFHLFFGNVYPRVEVSPGYFSPNYFKPFSGEGQQRYNLPLTTVVGLGGVVTGQWITQPLSQESAQLGP